MSISLCNQSQITNRHHKEVTLNPTKPSPSLHIANTSIQNHTDFTGFYNSFTECNMNNYKKLNKGRKHLQLQYTRNPIDQFLNHNKAQKQSC